MNIKRLFTISGSLSLGLTIILIWLLFGPPILTSAASYTVCPAGPPTCDYNSVQSAVDSASGGDVIKVAAGTYTGINNKGGQSQVVYIDKSLTIRGGYTTSNWTTSDPVANPTTLDAHGGGRVLYITGNISPTIEGLHITGGDATVLGNGGNGGGIYNGLDSNLTVANVTVMNNSGDGIFNDGGMLRVMNSTVSNNYGDGINSFHPFESRWVTMTGSKVEDNSKAGIRGINTELTVSRSSISGNQDRGVWNAGDLIFKDVSITGNNRGGISAVNNSLATLEGVTISGNFTSGEGGGIYYWGLPGGTATMTNVTISGNIAVESGGGIMAASGTHSNMAFFNVTITNNTAASGGGIYNESSTTFTNSIVADNTGGNCDGGNNVTSNGHNLDSGNTCGFSSTGDKSNTSPLLGPLANNGGPILTHALLDGSPAIDAGNPVSCPATDQRGLFRVDGDNNGSIICDIGAFEFDGLELEPKEKINLPIVLNNYGH